MKFKNPIEIMRMIMAIMHALYVGHLTVVWTDHGAARAVERASTLPNTTKKLAEHRRPFVIDLNTASWYLTNKDESLFLVVSDKLFGQFVLHYAETNKRWVIVTTLAPSMFRKRRHEIKTDSLPELLSQITLIQIEQEAPEEPVETPLDEVIEDTTEDSDVVDASLSDADYDDEIDESLVEAAQEGLRNNALIHLNQLPHKSLLQLRKHLKITGNGTGKRGVVTKEWAIKSILDFMDARKDYSFEF